MSASHFRMENVSPYRALVARRHKAVLTGLDPGPSISPGFSQQKLLNPGYHKVVPMGLHVRAWQKIGKKRGLAGGMDRISSHTYILTSAR